MIDEPFCEACGALAQVDAEGCFDLMQACHMPGTRAPDPFDGRRPKNQRARWVCPSCLPPCPTDPCPTCGPGAG